MVNATYERLKEQIFHRISPLGKRTLEQKVREDKDKEENEVEE